MCDLMPPTDDLPGLADTDVDGFLRRFRRESNLAVWSGVVAGAAVYTLSPPFTIRRPLPSFLLPPEARDRHAAAITTSPSYLVRQSIFLLKMFAGMCWGQDPEVRRRMNLDPYAPDPGTFRTT